MQFFIKKSKKKWTLRTNTNVLVGSAEALILRDMTVRGSGFLAEIDSIWGAELTDEAYSQPKIIRHLGINKPFVPTYTRRIHKEKGIWVDATGILIKAAPKVVLTGGFAFL